MSTETPQVFSSSSTRYQTLRDTLLPLLLAIAVPLALPIVFNIWTPVLLTYVIHGWFFAVVLAWVVFFRLRFPLGS